MSLLTRAFMRPNVDMVPSHLSHLPATAGGSEKRVFQSSVFATAAPGDDSWGLYTQMRDEQAIRLTAVYACVRIIADAVASLPLAAFSMNPNSQIPERLQQQPTLITNPGGSGPGDPNPFEFWFQVVASLALVGNAYCVVMRRDYREYPIQLFPVHPYMVQITRNTKDGKADYRVGDQPVPRYDMVHIKRFTLPGRLTGISPIGISAQGISLGLAAERFGARYFTDSGSPSAVMETDANLSKESADNLIKNWLTTHGGRRYPAVLSGGLKYRQITISPDEAQFLQTRQFQRSEIAMLFGVPPHMIGDVEKSTSWGTGIEQQGIGFVTYNLRPWLVCLESYLNMLTPRGTFAQFDVDALMRGDAKSRWEAHMYGRNSGALSVNDIRAEEKLPPVANGDIRLQPMNMVPLGTKPEDYPKSARNPGPSDGDTPDSPPKNDSNNSDSEDGTSNGQ